MIMEGLGSFQSAACLLIFFMVTLSGACAMGEVHTSGNKCVGGWRNVTVSNRVPRTDEHNKMFDAHDGTIIHWNGTYLYYGMGYGGCDEGITPFPCLGHRVGSCGFQNNHSISLWESKDLSSGSWSERGEVLRVEDRPLGIYYRPKVVWNEATQSFVLWVNYLHKDFKHSRYLVATSPTPSGPFTVENDQVPTRYPLGGDFDIWIRDEDGAAFLIYTSIDSRHRISVEQLSDDYLSSRAAPAPSSNDVEGAFYASTGQLQSDGRSPRADRRLPLQLREDVHYDETELFSETLMELISPSHDSVDPSPTQFSSGFLPHQTSIANCNESPAIFRRQGVLYALFGHCCCMCGWGANIKVYTATDPLGPWTYHEDVGSHYLGIVPVTKAQQAFVIETKDASGDEQLVWVGDQWQSSPDRVKAHDLQYWSVIEFDDSVSPPMIKQFEWEDDTTFEMPC